MTLEIALTLATVIALFVSFTKFKLPVELMALIAVSFLMVTGVLKTSQLLSVFSNSAAMTVAAMFILSSALDKTGVIDYLGKLVMAISAKSNLLALGSIFALVFFASFFINNTSIVLIMIPVMIALAHNISLSASKLLIPLSYVSILAGTCTLIGTSTNLLVDGVAQRMGLEPFGMFEILIPGLIMAAIGGVYLLLIGRHLLPVRESLSEFFASSFDKQYITQIVISKESELAGKTLKQAGFTEENGYHPVRIIKAVEDNQKMRFAKIFSGSEIAKIFREKIESKDFTTEIDAESVLELDDRLVVMTSQREILYQAEKEEEVQEVAEENIEVPIKTRAEKRALAKEAVLEDQTITLEGIVAPDSSFAGKEVRQLHLSEIYDVDILAVHRHKGKISNDFDNVQLSVGDTLLLRGKESELKRIFDNDELLNLSKPAQEPYDFKKAPIAIAAIAIAVTVAALNIMPIAGAAFIAAVIVVMLGCIKSSDAYKALHGQVLLLIYAMLAISVAMESTGALKLIVDSIIGLVKDLPPYVVISILYLLTSCLTEVFSNNATAVMLTPIAIALAMQMGVDPRPFAVAVMFGASASFATPIGYQTNTLVFNAGGYKFMDYVKIGLPMNIIMWIAASFIIPWYWDM